MTTHFPFLPPFILRHIARHADADDKRYARTPLTHDRQARAARMELIAKALRAAWEGVGVTLSVPGGWALGDARCARLISAFQHSDPIPQRRRCPVMR